MRATGREDGPVTGPENDRAGKLVGDRTRERPGRRTGGRVGGHVGKHGDTARTRERGGEKEGKYGFRKEGKRLSGEERNPPSTELAFTCVACMGAKAPQAVKHRD